MNNDKQSETYYAYSRYSQSLTEIYLEEQCKSLDISSCGPSDCYDLVSLMVWNPQIVYESQILQAIKILSDYLEFGACDCDYSSKQWSIEQ